MDFVRYVREKMNPLEPIPSGVEPRLRALSGIRAVIFDIYGTLLISGAGDNSLISEQKSVSAMKNAISELPGSESIRANEVLQRYTLLISEHQERRRHEGIQFPEIEIREVWKDLFSEFFSDPISNETLEQVARIYEYEVTECWEMPGAGDVVRNLHEGGYRLGIISNAQFYTPALVDAFLGTPLDLTVSDGGPNRGSYGSQPCSETPRSTSSSWNTELTLLSFQIREGKPSVRLYERIRDAAEKMGMKSQEILYIGNDFCKDVAPAQKVGFRTGLFAGDARSLQAGPDGLPAALKRADVVLTELQQIDQVLSARGI
jgi:putative hydrolase of the HAD superfamily